MDDSTIRRSAMKKPLYVTIVTLILCLILVGCNFPKQKPQENQVDLLNTAAAQTVQAKQTLIAQPSEVLLHCHLRQHTPRSIRANSLRRVPQPPNQSPNQLPCQPSQRPARQKFCDGELVSKRYLMAQIFLDRASPKPDYQKHRFMHLDCRLSCCFLQW